MPFEIFSSHQHSNALTELAGRRESIIRKRAEKAARVPTEAQQALHQVSPAHAVDQADETTRQKALESLQQFKAFLKEKFSEYQSNFQDAFQDRVLEGSLANWKIKLNTTRPSINIVQVLEASIQESHDKNFKFFLQSCLLVLGLPLTKGLYQEAELFQEYMERIPQAGLIKALKDNWNPESKTWENIAEHIARRPDISEILEGLLGFSRLSNTDKAKASGTPFQPDKEETQWVLALQRSFLIQNILFKIPPEKRKEIDLKALGQELYLSLFNFSSDRLFSTSLINEELARLSILYSEKFQALEDLLGRDSYKQILASIVSSENSTPIQIRRRAFYDFLKLLESEPNSETAKKDFMKGLLKAEKETSPDIILQCCLRLAELGETQIIVDAIKEELKAGNSLTLFISTMNNAEWSPTGKRDFQTALFSQVPDLLEKIDEAGRAFSQTHGDKFSTVSLDIYPTYECIVIRKENLIKLLQDSSNEILNANILSYLKTIDENSLERLSDSTDPEVVKFFELLDKHLGSAQMV